MILKLVMFVESNTVAFGALTCTLKGERRTREIEKI